LAALFDPWPDRTKLAAAMQRRMRDEFSRFSSCPFLRVIISGGLSLA
jgi:hypothetical protein